MAGVNPSASIALLGYKRRQHRRQRLHVAGLDQDGAGAVELVDQALPGGEAEGAGSDLDLIIQSAAPGDDVNIVNHQGR